MVLLKLGAQVVVVGVTGSGVEVEMGAVVVVEGPAAVEVGEVVVEVTGPVV